MALALGALGVGFALGRAAPGEAAPLWQRIVNEAHDDPVNGEVPDGVPAGGDPREVIPLTPGAGQQPQPPGPRAGSRQGECTVLMFRDGQFYRMEPGAGVPLPGGAAPGADSELFPVQPPPAPDAPQFPGPEMRS